MLIVKEERESDIDDCKRKRVTVTLIIVEERGYSNFETHHIRYGHQVGVELKNSKVQNPKISLPYRRST